jgi:TonB family protein
MYLDFDDYRPDIQPIGRAISWREGILIAFIVHLLLVIVLLVLPKGAPDQNRRPIPLDLNQEKTMVFVQPRNDTPARKPALGDLSDKDRNVRTPRAPNPTNPLPFSRGNTPEKVEIQPPPPSRSQGPRPDPAESQQAENRPQDTQAQPQTLPESPSGQFPSTQTVPSGRGTGTTTGGGFGDALRNLQRFAQSQTFDNPQGGGGGGQFGDLQFDTKGVEFGPWVRRFIAQVRSNWLIPYAAMSSKGHVVITFNVHRNGAITDLQVVGPSAVVPFNNAAFGALSASNPTQQLPPEYPADKAFFTLTFFYNETPPGGR